ncbi:hypothetical protein [Mucilaginibacter sp. HD30]
MSLREQIYYTFYGLGFLISILVIDPGYTNSHTPPASFVISLMVCLAGIVLCVIDVVLGKPIKVHLIGSSANFAIVAAVVGVAYW